MSLKICLPVAQVCVCTAEDYLTNSVIDLSWQPRRAFEVIAVVEERWLKNGFL